MPDTYISVDIEASGPVPGEFSLLSLGACVVGATEKNFYIELQPITLNFNPESLAVAGLDLDYLAREGTEPTEGMQAFDAWLREVTPRDRSPIFAAYPLAFDWMFVAYYFERFLRRNPFGYSGFDVKSFYMGLTGERWTANSIARRFPRIMALTHNAREDAIVQAELLNHLFEYARKQRTST